MAPSNNLHLSDVDLLASDDCFRNGIVDIPKGRWVLTKEDLSFIKSAEWVLVSITSYLTMNFIIYIFLEAQTSLAIVDSTTNAFLLPQWYSVMVLHPNHPRLNHLTKQALKPTLIIFAAQLFSLHSVTSSWVSAN
jgi:hypothetical protein